MQRLNELIDIQKSFEDEITETTERLEFLKHELKRVSEIEIPERMAELELNSFTMADGSKVELTNNYYGSIPASDPVPALEWLEAHGLGGVINREFKIESKGDLKNAEEIKTLLTDGQLNYREKTAVHHQTMKALVRERLESGLEFPLEIFNAGKIIKTKIKRKK